MDIDFPDGAKEPARFFSNPGDTDVGSIPGWKDPLEKELIIHSSILALKNTWTEEPRRL